jgi:hypothetical protein
VCSGGCPKFDTPGMVWASWAAWIDNCWCASDLKVDEIFCEFACFVLFSEDRGRVDIDLFSNVVGVSCMFAMV